MGFLMGFVPLRIKRQIDQSVGSSMVEIMVVVLIFSFISAGLYTSAVVGQRTWETNKVQIELQQELRKSMEAMIDNLRQAGNTSIVNVPSDGNWYTTITFKTPSGVASGNITWNTDTIQYLVAGTELQEKIGTDTNIISHDISALQFRRQASAPETLEVALQGQKNTAQGDTLQYDLGFSVQLRN